jgi:hypothetical protein
VFHAVIRERLEPFLTEPGRVSPLHRGGSLSARLQPEGEGLGLPLAAIREFVATAFEQPSGRARVRLLEILMERIAQTGEQIAMLARLRKEPWRRRQAATG